jgi:hypothetical protein
MVIKNFEEIRRSLENKINKINSYQSSTYKKDPRVSSDFSNKLSQIRAQEQNNRLATARTPLGNSVNSSPKPLLKPISSNPSLNRKPIVSNGELRGQPLRDNKSRPTNLNNNQNNTPISKLKNNQADERNLPNIKEKENYDDIRGIAERRDERDRENPRDLRSGREENLDQARRVNKDLPPFGRARKEQEFEEPLQGRSYNPLEFNSFERDTKDFKISASPVDRVKGKKPRDFSTFLREELGDNSYKDKAEDTFNPDSKEKKAADGFPEEKLEARYIEKDKPTYEKNNNDIISSVLEGLNNKDLEGKHREILRNIDLSKDFVLKDVLHKNENAEHLFEKLKDDVLHNIKHTYLKLISNLKEEIGKLKEVPISYRGNQSNANYRDNEDFSYSIQRSIQKVRDDLVDKIEKEKDTIEYAIKNIEYLNNNIKDFKDNLFKYADESYKKTLIAFQTDLQRFYNDLMQNNVINNDKFAELNHSLLNKTQQIFTTLSNNIIEELKHVRQDILAISKDDIEGTIGDYIEELRYDVLRKISKNHISLTDKVDKIAEKIDTNKEKNIELKESNALDNLTNKIQQLNNDIIERKKPDNTLDSSNLLLNFLNKQLESNTNNKLQDVVNKIESYTQQQSNKNSNDFEKTVLNTLLSKALENKQENSYLKDFINYKLVKEITKEEEKYTYTTKQSSNNISIENSMKNLESMITQKLEEVKLDITNSVDKKINEQKESNQKLFNSSANNQLVSDEISKANNVIIDEISKVNNTMIDTFNLAINNLKNQYNTFLSSAKIEVQTDNKEIEDHLYAIANKVDYLINFTKLHNSNYYNEAIFGVIDEVSVNLKEVSKQKKEINDILHRLNNDLVDFSATNLSEINEENLKHKIALLENIQKNFTTNYLTSNNNLLDNIAKIESRIGKMLDMHQEDKSYAEISNLPLHSNNKEVKTKNVDIMANMSYINQQISKKI